MDSETAYERIAQLLGCKWSVRILTLLSTGPQRPSEILKQVDHLAAKVMHRCLNRMEKDGLLQKKILPEVPPHTEYSLTPHGVRFMALLDSARQMASDWQGTQPPVR